MLRDLVLIEFLPMEPVVLDSAIRLRSSLILSNPSVEPGEDEDELDMDGLRFDG